MRNAAAAPKPGLIRGNEFFDVWRGGAQYGADFNALTQFVVRDDPGSSYTCDVIDQGKLVPCSSLTTVSLPSAFPYKGYNISFLQTTLNQITFSGSFLNVSSQTKSGGQGAICTALVYAVSSAGVASWVLTGTTGA